MESRLEEIFSMGISCMSLAVWLVEDRKCSAAVVGLDLVLGLSMVRQWATKVLRHLAIKLILERLGHIPPPPFPPSNVDFSICSTAQTIAPTQH